MSDSEFVEAVSFNGYLTHAVRNQPELFTQTAPYIIVTYTRALCGVGRGGMRVRQHRDTGKVRDWVGVDGCDRCHARVHKLKQAAA